MNKLFGIMCVIVLFTGCGYREKQFNEESEKIKDTVTDACKKINGKLIIGVEYTYGTWGDEITVGYYCQRPSEEKEDE